MKTCLYLLQHGNAVSRDTDELRPLSVEGRADVERLAQRMAEWQVPLQHIIHSGKLRAEQTAQIISEQLAAGIVPTAYSGIGPNDNAEAFVDDLDMSRGNILLVSHMPFVTRLCSVLLTGNSSALFEFTPGTLACMNFQDGVWSLSFMIRPDVV